MDGPPIEFWLNVESFALNEGKRSPCDIKRCRRRWGYVKVAQGEW
jgi:hypothetical protein